MALPAVTTLRPKDADRVLDPAPFQPEDVAPSAVAPLHHEDNERTLLRAILSRLDNQAAAITSMQKDLALIKSHLGSTETKREEPRVIEISNKELSLGCDGVATFPINKVTYYDIFNKVSGPKELVLKVMSAVFSNQELAMSNFHGGEVICKGGVVRKQAPTHSSTFQAVLAQAQKEFPEATRGETYRKALTEAVNGKCRKVTTKLGGQ